MQAEAKYYCIEELERECDALLGQFGDSRDDVVPICRVPLITRSIICKLFL